jgi:flagellar hook-associated protein 3 FlgL
VRRPVADGETLVVNADNEATFGTYVGTAGGTYSGSVFEVLEKISNDLRNNDLSAAGLGAALGALDSARSRMSIVQSAVGAKSRRVDDLLSRNLNLDGDLRHAISELEDVDMAKVLLDLRIQESNYQAALSVTARVIQPSLVDFLR